jgi:hypothetical protein
LLETFVAVGNMGLSSDRLPHDAVVINGSERHISLVLKSS